MLGVRTLIQERLKNEVCWKVTCSIKTWGLEAKGKGRATDNADRLQALTWLSFWRKNIALFPFVFLPPPRRNCHQCLPISNWGKVTMCFSIPDWNEETASPPHTLMLFLSLLLSLPIPCLPPQRHTGLPSELKTNEPLWSLKLTTRPVHGSLHSYCLQNQSIFIFSSSKERGPLYTWGLPSS